jgi:hypothetical protein
MVLPEKGTVRGVLRPVLDELAVGFFPVHGFSSATAAHDLAMDDDGRDLILLYVGDYDPSGMFMSEQDGLHGSQSTFPGVNHFQCE